MGLKGANGETRTYPVTETIHREEILRESVAPARTDDAAVVAEAESVARDVLDVLDGRGVYGIELFETRDGEVLVNEIAPRPTPATGPSKARAPRSSRTTSGPSSGGRSGRPTSSRPRSRRTCSGTSRRPSPRRSGTLMMCPCGRRRRPPLVRESRRAPPPEDGASDGDGPQRRRRPRRPALAGARPPRRADVPGRVAAERCPTTPRPTPSRPTPRARRAPRTPVDPTPVRPDRGAPRVGGGGDRPDRRGPRPRPGRSARVREDAWSDGWILPGGAVEPGESPASSRRRGRSARRRGWTRGSGTRSSSSSSRTSTPSATRSRSRPSTRSTRRAPLGRFRTPPTSGSLPTRSAPSGGSKESRRRSTTATSSARTSQESTANRPSLVSVATVANSLPSAAVT